MRTESAAHLAARLPRKTKPRYFCTFHHVPRYGSPSEYAFSVDFASGAIASAARAKLNLLENISGAFAQVYPEQGRASTGSIELTLTNASNLALQYLSMPTFHLAAAMTAGSPGAGGTIAFAETVLNIPAAGTLEITTGGVIERVRYTGLDEPAKTVEVIARGVDDTTAADHAIGDTMENGEQIRPGQRCQLYAGYDGLAEADFMAFQKMEVVGRRLHEDGEAFVIELGDVMRSLRREVFLTASDVAPWVIQAHPLELLLHVLLSTGTGINGTYDDWPAHMGLGIPAAYVDVTGIEYVASLVTAPDFRFDIRAPENAKDWIERELLQPCNVYPVVNQDGQYSCRRFGGQR